MTGHVVPGTRQHFRQSSARLPIPAQRNVIAGSERSRRSNHSTFSGSRQYRRDNFNTFHQIPGTDTVTGVCRSSLPVTAGNNTSRPTSSSFASRTVLPSRTYSRARMSRIGINQVGYIPFVGCFIGVTRIVWGIFQMIAALSVMPFDYDWGHRYSICALHSWGRGGLELIPFGGGIVLYSYDYR